MNRSQAETILRRVNARLGTLSDATEESAKAAAKVSEASAALEAELSDPDVAEALATILGVME